MNKEKYNDQENKDRFCEHKPNYLLNFYSDRTEKVPFTILSLSSQNKGNQKTLYSSVYGSCN
ncbi:Uncharacterized protein dnl_61740 [Desulfonema limicola]|uniref:Uncharacterized protein n=1 Tax=Desulfonema limicola TaxID=45656 RepID=A0A975GJP2_9BACT|nr:hypothetical protein [Desulfonema limicola]QTA83759.1 Uncharacterized protein dnl_61740 [Desulfonema limicola]